MGDGVRAHTSELQFRQRCVQGRRTIRARQPNVPEFHRLLSWDEAAANRIHDVMNRMADGGDLYTLSQQPGTVLSENAIYDIDRSLGLEAFLFPRSIWTKGE